MGRARVHQSHKSEGIFQVLNKQSSKNLNSSDSPGPLLNVNFLLNYSAPHLNDFVAMHFVQSNEILNHSFETFAFNIFVPIAIYGTIL